MSDNTELWDEIATMRRDIRVLKAAVRRLEGQLPELQDDLNLFQCRESTRWLIRLVECIMGVSLMGG